ncbi:MAG: hypothetical protein AAB074_18000 [Planctomycetota bacterium]
MAHYFVRLFPSGKSLGRLSLTHGWELPAKGYPLRLRCTLEARVEDQSRTARVTRKLLREFGFDLRRLSEKVGPLARAVRRMMPPSAGEFLLPALPRAPATVTLTFEQVGGSKPARCLDAIDLGVDLSRFFARIGERERKGYLLLDERTLEVSAVFLTIDTPIFPGRPEI